MGINEWLVPQISEHCPLNIPSRFEKMKIWFRRPGKASTFTPKAGTVQEWITSKDVTNPRIGVFRGRIRVSLVFRSRKIFDGDMKFSVSNRFKLVYS